MRVCATMTSRRPRTPEEFGIGLLFRRIREAVVLGDVATGRIVLWNPAAKLLFGYTADEAIGQSLEQLMPEPFRTRHREGLARYRETGQGVLIEAGVPTEVPALTKHGETRTIELTLTEVDRAAGRRYSLAIIRDVTERKRAEGG